MEDKTVEEHRKMKELETATFKKYKPLLRCPKACQPDSTGFLKDDGTAGTSSPGGHKRKNMACSKCGAKTLLTKGLKALRDHSETSQQQRDDITSDLNELDRQLATIDERTKTPKPMNSGPEEQEAPDAKKLKRSQDNDHNEDRKMEAQAPRTLYLTTLSSNLPRSRM
jgi:hypothetical protein